MAADDTRDMLQFVGSFLQQKHQNFGGLRAKTTLFENAFMAVNAALQVDQRNRAEVYHEDNVIFGPLLAESMDTAAPRIMQTCQLMADDQYTGLCERFVAYSSTLNDPNQRIKAMSLFGVMVASRYQNTAGGYAGQQQALPTPQAPPREVIKYIERPEPPSPPPHQHEPLFRPYMELGPKGGSDRLAVEFGRMSRMAATEFLRSFVDFAVTLRTSEQLRTAFALSNKMYQLFLQMREGNVIALTAPTRRV